ncbi:MAG: RnfABCDGE type electron transport complex subunit G [Bacteroidetes bacterium]|jgi:Na+-translocating ferredoxin:NAD+ oxidoreductase subunit G|nr:RnfABCDGE type electron transport complex subunit G [Bacteroidota bacterium]MBT6687696.1 RnfABCDGE type electron transport complex subunit G [Bacteroidota bacterium]MBT7143619.1 RnfABCDGE type electron transport complex subunit G [Bacteroidota bacterium]MBT7490520.1 RnfABCDGE type electron transport complex subunit G [Bacteroidota bacterium]
MASKKESTFVNMVLTLFLVALVASTALGFVYELTKAPIAAAKLKRKLEAINTVVPGFTNDPNAEMYKIPIAEGDSLEFYPAKKDGELIGTAIKTYTKKGFSGLIQLMVGFSPEGEIINISVLDHKETPGLGDKMQKDKSEWSNQFNGKNPANDNLVVTKDGGLIDAITASTISSRAYCDAVQRAYDIYMKNK